MRSCSQTSPQPVSRSSCSVSIFASLWRALCQTLLGVAFGAWRDNLVPKQQSNRGVGRLLHRKRPGRVRSGAGWRWRARIITKIKLLGSDGLSHCRIGHNKHHLALLSRTSSRYRDGESPQDCFHACTKCAESKNPASIAMSVSEFASLRIAPLAIERRTA